MSVPHEIEERGRRRQDDISDLFLDIILSRETGIWI